MSTLNEFMLLAICTNEPDRAAALCAGIAHRHAVEQLEAIKDFLLGEDKEGYADTVQSHIDELNKSVMKPDLLGEHVTEPTEDQRDEARINTERL